MYRNAYLLLRERGRIRSVSRRFEIGKFSITLRLYEFGKAYGHMNMGGPGFRHKWNLGSYALYVEWF